MINAGLEILPFDGFQHFDSDVNLWRGITCKANFPAGETITTNPTAPGDMVIEPNGQAWEVMVVEVVSEAKNQVRLDIRLISDTPSSSITPGMGSVSRGAIVTPMNGFIAPYWDSAFVSPVVGRIAAYLTHKKMADAWAGSVDLGYL